MKTFHALVLSAVLFNYSGLGRADTNSDVQSLKSMIAIMKAELVDLKLHTQAIGSLQQAFLSEAEFQKQMGKNWVLCDGRSVAGSTYAALGYGNTVPNCTGRFLRSAGGAAAPLRTLQEQAVDVRNISASTIVTKDLSVSVSGTTDATSWNGDLSGAINEQNLNGVDYAGVEAWKNGLVGRDIGYWNRMFNHTHTFSGSGSASGGTLTTTLSNSGDKETRPTNITVNTFIKIN